MQKAYRLQEAKGLPHRPTIVAYTRQPENKIFRSHNKNQLFGTMARRPLLSFFIAALSLGISDASLLDGDTCVQLGFSPSTLLCSSCDELSAFNLGKLQKDCKECCQDDKASQDEVCVECMFKILSSSDVAIKIVLKY